MPAHCPAAIAVIKNAKPHRRSRVKRGTIPDIENFAAFAGILAQWLWSLALESPHIMFLVAFNLITHGHVGDAMTSQT
jgi:hypothetical protein